MSARVFLDTNLFVYAVDSSKAEQDISEQARHLIRSAIEHNSGIISVQVLQEFYNTATRKIATPLTPDQALEYVAYMGMLEVVEPSFAMVTSAIHLSQRLKFSFSDSMIVQAALTADCAILLSEDMQHGQRIDGMVIDNPFVTSGRQSRGCSNDT